MRFMMIALFVVLGWAHEAEAQEAATEYPKMAPIDQSLMADQSAEIALARSAAPESISPDAEVMVLGRHGLVTAVKGKNGFVCIVRRSWTSAPDCTSQCGSGGEDDGVQHEPAKRGCPARAR